MLFQRIKEIRKLSGFTQKEVAEYLKITQPAYASYESGRRTPDIDTLIQLANFYNTSVDYLSGRINNEMSDNQNVIIGKRFKLFRNAKQLTISDMSNKLNIKVEDYSELEGGTNSHFTFDDICLFSKKLELDVFYFFYQFSENETFDSVSRAVFYDVFPRACSPSHMNSLSENDINDIISKLSSLLKK